MKKTIRSIALLFPALAFSVGLSAAPSEVEVSDFLDDYFAVHQGLAEDDLAAAQAAAGSLGEKATVAKASDEVVAAADAFAGTADLEAARALFQPLSIALQAVLESTGTKGATVFVVRCPMAFDGEGGTWLQNDRKIANPYFGTKMRSCGSVTGEVKVSNASDGTRGHENG